MPAYLCCPARQCAHRIPHISGSAEEMTDHLVDKHGFPEVSASYQASVLRPINATTQAA